MDSKAYVGAVAADAEAALRVRSFTPEDAARWDAFVETCSEATFFHRCGWKNILEACFGHRTHYLLAERGARLVGVLPLAEVKSVLFGHALISLPFCAVAGVAAVDTSAATELHRVARELGKRLGAEHLELRNSGPRQADWPRQDLYASFRREIFPDVEANMRASPRKQRAMVRKGIGNGLQSRLDAGVDTFFSLYADNVHRHGTPPLAKRYFAMLRKIFGPDTEVLTVIDQTGRAVSSVFSFYFRGEVLPYYAGDTLAARDLAANDFKYWELMRRACERGVRVFDYGRSKRGTGPYDFKKNWGFEPAPLAYEYCLYRRESIPQNNPLNPKYRALIALWRHLPIPVANFLGPHLVKGLG
jgi:FemAB-related protein (PEP-CTERM system-associated)